MKGCAKVTEKGLFLKTGSVYSRKSQNKKKRKSSDSVYLFEWEVYFQEISFLANFWTDSLFRFAFEICFWDLLFRFALKTTIFFEKTCFHFFSRFLCTRYLKPHFFFPFFVPTILLYPDPNPYTLDHRGRFMRKKHPHRCTVHNARGGTKILTLKYTQTTSAYCGTSAKYRWKKDNKIYRK